MDELVLPTLLEDAEAPLTSALSSLAHFVAGLSKDHRAAYMLGIKDGLENPYELTSGVSWNEGDSRNEVYDLGANLGQAVGLLRVSKTSKHLA